MSALVRSAGVKIVTHLHWRFVVPLSTWPYTLVRVVDRGLSAAARAEVAKALLDTPDCDLDRDFTLKVKKLCHWCRSPADVLSYTAVLGVLEQWAKHAVLGNMHIERHIGQEKKGAHDDKPGVERLGAAGAC